MRLLNLRNKNKNFVLIHIIILEISISRKMIFIVVAIINIANSYFVLKMTKIFSIFEACEGETLPYGILSHVPKGEGRVDILKYIIDNCLDDNGSFSWYWTWNNEYYEFTSETLNKWFTLLMKKHREYHERNHPHEPLPQTLLRRKENGSYILELQTYDYCEAGTDTIFELQNDEVQKYLETFQNKGLYNYDNVSLP